jgi:hypothetical protein
MRNRRIGLLPLAVLIAVPGAVSLAAAPQPTQLQVSTLIDSIDHGRDIIATVRSDTHVLRDARVAWLRGVAVRIPWYRHDVELASYDLVTGDGQSSSGGLWAEGVRRPAQSARRKITLRSRQGDGVRGVLHGGSHPRFDVTLPPATHYVEITTVGAGRALLKFPTDCRHHAKKYRWRITTHFSDATPTRTKHGTVDVSCGLKVRHEGAR